MSHRFVVKISIISVFYKKKQRDLFGEHEDFTIKLRKFLANLRKKNHLNKVRNRMWKN